MADGDSVEGCCGLFVDVVEGGAEEDVCESSVGFVVLESCIVSLSVTVMVMKWSSTVVSVVVSQDMMTSSVRVVVRSMVVVVLPSP